MSKFSTIRIKKLLEKSDAAKLPDHKGAALEELGCYLFGKLKGLELYAKNKFNKSGSRELDIIYKNDRRISDLHFLDSFIPIECKNTTKKTTSEQVNWFANKVSDTTARYGILLTLSGITGKDETEAAKSEIIKAVHKLQVGLLIITRNEIENLVSTEDLAKLLHQKFFALCLEERVGLGFD
ncbi:restriction endonuclease [Pedobacter sp. Leaf250]|uniref:restriction endonuclease n=1 Tax=Pedobacter sp. Leaf250 TaxID=2876559 RepID=UPI001E3BB372|nr:restriction endonuclease [Pedobacter sp. Leaf250]